MGKVAVHNGLQITSTKTAAPLPGLPARPAVLFVFPFSDTAIFWCFYDCRNRVKARFLVYTQQRPEG